MAEKTKIDFKTEYKNLYKPTNKIWEQITVPTLSFLTLSGKGDPNTSKIYAESVQTLYAVSYAIKFLSKNTLGKDYVVGPLEGLWWADDPDDFKIGNKDRWQWTMMILKPDWIDQNTVEEMCSATSTKKQLPLAKHIKVLTCAEGLCAQMLHVGPYSEEKPKLAYLHDVYMKENNLDFNGKHHEIYLSDPRKTEANKLKTVLRQPLKLKTDK